MIVTETDQFLCTLCWATFDDAIEAAQHELQEEERTFVISE